jgi:hypothetical protein
LHCIILELAQEEALGKDPHRKKSLGPRKMIPSEERRPPYTPGCINDMAGDSAGFPTVDSWVSLAIDAEGILGGGEARTPDYRFQLSTLLVCTCLPGIPVSPNPPRRQHGE